MATVNTQVRNDQYSLVGSGPGLLEVFDDVNDQLHYFRVHIGETQPAIDTNAYHILSRDQPFFWPYSGNIYVLSSSADQASVVYSS